MMRQYRELKRRYPGLPAAVPPRRLLRALLRGRRRPALAPPPDHADVAAEGRGGDPDGGHPAPRRRRLHRPAHPRGPEGGGVRADGGARPRARSSSAATSCASSRRARSPTPQFLDGAAQQLSPRRRTPDRRRDRRRARGRVHRRLLGGRGAGRGRSAPRGRAPAPPRGDAAGRERGARAGRAPGSPAGVPVDPRRRSAGLRAAPGRARDARAALPRGQSLDAFGVGDLTAGLQAAGGRARLPARDPGRRRSAHLTRLQRLAPATRMLLDPTAVATLELFETAQERTTRGSLFATLDETGTPMGARLLRQWLLRPLLDREAIGAPPGRRRRPGGRPGRPGRACGRRLEGVGDLERLTSRAALGRGPRPRPRRPARASWAACRGSRRRWRPSTAPSWGRSPRRSRRCPTFRNSSTRRSRTSRRSRLQDGGLIRESWNAELRELKQPPGEAQEWIASLEERERARTGHRHPSRPLQPRLRLRDRGEQRPRRQGAGRLRAPADPGRRRALRHRRAQGVREPRCSAPRSASARLEFELFGEVRAEVAAAARPRCCATARAVGTLDVLASLAEVAHAARLRAAARSTTATRSRSSTAAIRCSRRRGERRSRPTTWRLDPATRQIMILTGPNMSGKSVFMRQIALLVLMAQMGSFVPARSARIGLVDRIFTRVGAQDNLARGQSTFLVEMVETASILHHATRAEPDPARRGRARHLHLRRPRHRLGGDRGAARARPRRQGALRHPLPRADRAGRAAAAACATSTWRCASGTTRSSSCTRCGRAAPTAPTASRSRGWPGCRRPVIARAKAILAELESERSGAAAATPEPPATGPPSSASSRRRHDPLLRGAGRARPGAT